MARLVWLREAQREFDEIVDFIALDKKLAAEKYSRKFIRDLNVLKEFPYAGKVVEEAPERGWRELVISPCRVFYRVEEKQVLILHVMRAERKLRVNKLNR